MRFRLERFLEFEETSDERNIKEILYLERAFEEKLELSGATFSFKYIVDRVDRLRDGSLLILDYKTGTDMPKPQGTDSLEKMKLEREAIRDRIRSFQLPLYYYFESRRYRGETLNAALYSLRNPGLTYFRDKKTDVERTMEICVNALDFILREILDPDAVFAADREKERTCRNCPFFYLCR
jgi:CRISPR/Cas system-associated exonuclease Cas4 (RecB family)